MTAQALRTTYKDPRAHFNRMAPDYLAGCEKVGWSTPQRLTTKLHLVAPIERPLEVLDFGTGRGNIPLALRERFSVAHVIGIDISDEMVRRTLEDGYIDEGYEGSVETLGQFPTNSRDLFSSCGVWDFLDESQSDHAITEAARIVRPKGYVALTYEPIGTETDGFRTLQHDPEILRAQFQRSGLHVIDQGRVEQSYTNFKTGIPVTNEYIIGNLG